MLLAFIEGQFVLNNEAHLPRHFHQDVGFMLLAEENAVVRKKKAYIYLVKCTKCPLL